MAHTIKAYYYTDPATAVAVDFMGAVADNDGIAVDAYQMGVPGIDQARNGSLYSDSPRPVYSKHSTVTDVLTVTVRGSTNTALYTNLHLLAKLGEYARLAAQSDFQTFYAYLELKPGGSSSGEVLYANIYDCRVELPTDWGNTVDATLTVEDVTVTIERGLWTPARGVSADSTPISLTGQAFAGSAASSADAGGDTSGLFYLELTHDAASTTGQIDRAIIGYRSKMLGGANYDDCGKFESESATMGTDTSSTADATASGGNIARCTFGTTTTAAIRISGAKIPYGTHRMFARMKITGTAVASVYLSYSDGTVAQGATFAANTAVLVSSTSYLVYDLGVVQSGKVDRIGSVALGTYQIYASLSSGSGNLDIDWVYCMPTEGYVTLNGLGIGTSSPTASLVAIVNNHGESRRVQAYVAVAPARTVTAALPQYTVSLSPMPGKSALYWLVGTNSGDVFDVGIEASLTISLWITHRFIMPSEI